MFRPNRKKSDANFDNRHTISNINRNSSQANENRPTIKSIFGKQDFDSNNFLYNEDDSFVSPSVQVKYSTTYDYNEKKIELVKDEFLFLINKTNQDWWLCLRLDENSTFFVPASYVKELDNRPKPNLVPPPRPPPPPPTNIDKNQRVADAENTNEPEASKVLTNKPEVKQRQLLNYSTSATNLPLNNEKENRLSSTYSLIAQREDDQVQNGSSPPVDVAAKVKLFSEFSCENNADSIIRDLDDCLNQEELAFKKIDANEIYSTVKSFTPVNETEIIHEGRNHIYENCPVSKPRPNNIVNRKAIEPNFSNDIVEEDIVDENQHEIIQTKQDEINDNLESYLDETDDDSKSDDETVEPELIVPRGWYMTVCNDKRKCFHNDYNDQRWYVTHDSHGRPYFYNSEGKSIWELDELSNSDLDPESAHFRKNFDERLGTFNNIYNRLSVRKNSNEKPTSPSYSVISNEIKSPKDKNQFFPKVPSTPGSHRVATGLSSNFRCVKIAEKGKKCKKKTVENYRVELASTNLLFIKEVKGGGEKLDLPIDFKGGKCYKVDIPKGAGEKDNSNKDSNNNNSKNDSKIKLTLKIGKKDKDIEDLADFLGSTKNGFLIETSSGYKILIIHESEAVVNEWVSEINSLISLNGGSSSNQLISPCNIDDSDNVKSRNFSKKDSIDENSYCDAKTVEFNARKESDTDKNVIFKNMKNFLGFNRLSFRQGDTSDNKDKSSNEIDNKFLTYNFSQLPPLPKKPPPQTDDRNTVFLKNYFIKGLLSSFLKQRPSYLELKEEGIIKECVFGSNLISLCQKENKIVPLFVEDIINEIENKGLDMDGIYRISGNLAEVQKVRHQVDQGKHNFKDFDIHVLCGAFKTFFRELEEPLIPIMLHEKFLYSTGITDQSKRLECTIELIKRMPLPHRETMRQMGQHLLNVVENSSQNRMTVQNVALVFGPNIIRSNPINDANNGFNPNIMKQNIVIEYILKNFNDLFPYSSTVIFDCEN